jgi:hypothetical protein
MIIKYLKLLYNYYYCYYILLLFKLLLLNAVFFAYIFYAISYNYTVQSIFNK